MLLAIGALSACQVWEPDVCPSGRQCPPGSVCAANQDICIATGCGNGVLEEVEGEACDDGNVLPGDRCNARCQIEECGNGTVDVGEVCDDQNLVAGDGCSAVCRSEYCDNGVVDSEFGEQCDDGNETPGDGCSEKCLVEVCGNGMLDIGESCDDGNVQSGDGCTGQCESEYCGNGGVDRDVGEECDDGNTQSGDGCSSQCRWEACGNGRIDSEAGEQCDDGNGVNGDGCSAACWREECGNDVVDVAIGEQCDGGNTQGGDGCSSECRLEECGNLIVDVAAGEQCDDGNVVDGDGCSGSCRAEYCGNGVTDVGEQCDDGNAQNGDGCSTVCGDENAARQVAAGWRHTCAVLASGAVRCWGANAAGQLGYGNTDRIGDDELPVSVGTVWVGGPVAQLVAGFDYTCALLASGAVRCWGGNFYGQLGYGNPNNIGDDELPASAGPVDVGGTVIQLAGSFFHTCALLATGEVRCWGGNSNGQLGYGHTNPIGDDELPVSAGPVDAGGTVIHLAAGYNHTCALLAGGTVRCWGNNVVGQLGYGHTNPIGDDELPVSVGPVDAGGTVIQLAAGNSHTCALLDTGQVRCWGGNSDGELGYGNTDPIGDDELPASAGPVNVGDNVTVIQLAAGMFHTCALLAGGAVRCWGSNFYGQLGYGHTNPIGDDELPASVGPVDVGGTVIQLAAGEFHTCAVLASGAVRCWGNNSSGRLGYGHTNHIGDNELPYTAGDVPIVLP